MKCLPDHQLWPRARVSSPPPSAWLLLCVAVAGVIHAQSPSVSVTVERPYACESPALFSAFRVARTGPAEAALTVHYAVAGSATNGADYAALTGSLTLAANQTSGLIEIWPAADAVREGRETVQVTLLPDSAYGLAQSTATLDIVDGLDGIYQHRLELESGVDSMRLNLKGVPGRKLDLETSEDLMSWSVMPGPELDALGEAAVQLPSPVGRKFFRARSTPLPTGFLTRWRAEYFDRADLTGTPALVAVEDQIPSFDWGDGSPASSIPVDQFSARWTTEIDFPGGEVEFTTHSDDGIRLRVDGQYVINNWTYHPLTTNTGTVVLPAGRHTIVLEFFEGGGGAVSRLSFAVASELPPAISFFTASPARIAPGENATLGWNSQRAVSLTASGGWSGPRDAVGTEIVQPSGTTTYKLVCTAANGLSASAETTVVVQPPAPQITGFAGTVASTDTVHLTWDPIPAMAFPLSAKWVSGYYLGYFWDWLMPPESVDMSVLTHFIFARVAPGGGGLGGAPGQVVDGAGTGHLPFVEDALISKAHASGKKALLMIGGEGDGPGFDASTADPAIRAVFISNLVGRLAARNYDGVDVDWEENLDTPQQRAQAVALLTELRVAANAHAHFQSPHAPVIISWPAFWGNTNYATITPWHAQIAALADQYNLMTYSMAGAWPGWQSWHHSPLRGAGASHPTSIESSVAEYTAMGVPLSKLGLGIGLYGIYYTTPPGSSAVTGPRQGLDTFTGVQVADLENNYHRLLADDAFTQPSGTYHWDAEAAQSYMSYTPAWIRYGNTPITYLTYEDDLAITAKGLWARENGLGGCIVWGMNYGEGSVGSGNPPLAAVKAAFLRGEGGGTMRYRVFADGRFVATTSGTNYSVSGLASSRPHTFVLAALDQIGQVVALSQPVILTLP